MNKMLLAALVLVAAGATLLFVARQNGNPAEPLPSLEPSPSPAPRLNEYITPPSLAENSGETFSFDYPEGFSVREEGYTTPGGGRYPAFEIQKTGGGPDDRLSIPGGVSTAPDPTCATAARSGERCEELTNGYILIARSNDADVLQAFDIVKENFEVIVSSGK